MLRDELIEAVADSYIDTHNQGLALVDDYAEAAFDAILDTLEANLDKIEPETFRMVTEDWVRFLRRTE